MKIQFAGMSGLGRCALRYYLLVENCGNRWRYGLCVKNRSEAVSIPDITVSRKEIYRLLCMMVRGSVTPVTAMDVVEDWLGREI